MALKKLGFAGSGVAVPETANFKLFVPSIAVNEPVPLRRTGWSGVVGKRTCSWAFSTQVPNSVVWTTPVAVAMKTVGSDVLVRTAVAPALAWIGAMFTGGWKSAFKEPVVVMRAAQTAMSTARFGQFIFFILVSLEEVSAFSSFEFMPATEMFFLLGHYMSVTSYNRKTGRTLHGKVRRFAGMQSDQSALASAGGCRGRECLTRKA